MLVVSACAQFPGPFGRSAADRGEARAVAQAADGQTVRPVTRPEDDPDGDATAPTAVAAAVPGQALGDTLAGLGAPTETGLWLRTGLVTQVMPGRIQAPDGTTALVELRPSGAPAGGQPVVAGRVSRAWRAADPTGALAGVRALTHACGLALP